jgi:hypothetical protein
LRLVRRSGREKKITRAKPASRRQDAKALRIFLCGSASWRENKEKNPAKQESRQGYWIRLCVLSAALNFQKN